MREAPSPSQLSGRNQSQLAYPGVHFNMHGCYIVPETLFWFCLGYCSHFCLWAQLMNTLTVLLMGAAHEYAHSSAYGHCSWLCSRFRLWALLM